MKFAFHGSLFIPHVEIKGENGLENETNCWSTTIHGMDVTHPTRDHPG